MKPLAATAVSRCCGGGAGQVGVPDVDVRRRGGQVDGEVDPAGERRAVGALHAQDPQPRVARVLGARGSSVGSPLPVEQVEAVVGEVRLDRAVAVHVEHAPRAPRRRAPGTRLACALRIARASCSTCQSARLAGPRVGVRARVEDRLVREAEVLHARDERVLLEREAEVGREQRDLGVAVVEHERAAHQPGVDAHHGDVRAHEAERARPVLRRDVGLGDPGSQLSGARGAGVERERERDGDQRPAESAPSCGRFRSRPHEPGKSSCSRPGARRPAALTSSA